MQGSTKVEGGLAENGLGTNGDVAVVVALDDVSAQIALADFEGAGDGDFDVLVARVGGQTELRGVEALRATIETHVNRRGEKGVVQGVDLLERRKEDPGVEPARRCPGAGFQDPGARLRAGYQ